MKLSPLSSRVVVAGGYYLRRSSPPNITEVVFSPGPVGEYDHNQYDPDILRQALAFTSFKNVFAKTPAITVFARNDLAFVRLAEDLGYNNKEYDEDAPFDFILYSPIHGRSIWSWNTFQKDLVVPHLLIKKLIL